MFTNLANTYHLYCMSTKVLQINWTIILLIKPSCFRRFASLADVFTRLLDGWNRCMAQFAGVGFTHWWQGSGLLASSIRILRSCAALGFQTKWSSGLNCDEFVANMPHGNVVVGSKLLVFTRGKRKRKDLLRIYWERLLCGVIEFDDTVVSASSAIFWIRRKGPDFYFTSRECCKENETFHCVPRVLLPRFFRKNP